MAHQVEALWGLMVGSTRSRQLILENWFLLLCPVKMVQNTCNWVVYVFNLARIGSITVNLKKYKGQQTEAKATFVCVCVCVYESVCVCIRRCSFGSYKVFMICSSSFHVTIDRQNKEAQLGNMKISAELNIHFSKFTQLEKTHFSSND